MPELDSLTVRVEADLGALTRELDAAADAQADFARELGEGGRQIDTALDGTDALADAVQGLGGAFSSAFRGAILEGRRLSDLLSGLEQDILRTLTRDLVTRPLSDTVSGFVGSAGDLLAGLFHGGGEVGADTTPRRRVPAALFADAPRFAGGGIVSRAPRLAPGEVPAILHRGEVVRTPAQEAALQRRIDGGVTIQPGAIVIQTPSPQAFSESRGQIEAMLADAVRRGRRGR